MKWYYWLLVAIGIVLVVRWLKSGPPPWSGKPGQTVEWGGKVYRWEVLDYGSNYYWREIGVAVKA